MEITKIMLGELASNCYVQPVGNGKCVVVDIGGDAPVLFRRLGMLGLEPAAILLTHGHYDHIAGVEQVREKYNIPVYVHTLDAHMLTDGHANLGDWISTQPFQPVQAWETVEDGDTLQFGDSTFTVLHTPGHTVGGCCYYCAEEQVLFSGDTLFHGSVGRTDFPTGSMGMLHDSIHRKLFVLPAETTVYPGHGEATDIAYEKRYNPY